MSKIICDVCGTSYPDAATQCPICGCVRSADAKVVAGNTEKQAMSDNGTYTYVKGGRFSKSNVKKRNKGRALQPVSKSVQTSAENADKKTDRGLVIAVLALLLAIVAVVVYISVRFFVPFASDSVDSIAEGDKNQNTTTNTNVTDSKIHCTGVTISRTSVEFDSAGAVLLLDVVLTPADTTDQVVFSSDNEAVATVDAQGKIVAVSNGEATITVTCGTVTAECKVVCNIEAQKIPEDTKTDETVAQEDFKLNRDDFSLFAKGESHVLYSGSIPADQITWSTDNSEVATVSGGKVVAVGPGVTKVHATYNGKDYACIVRCSFATTTDNNVQTDASTVTGSCTLNYSDVTLKVGESIQLQLKDSTGYLVATTWSASSSAVTISDNTVTGKSVNNYVKVYTTYGGAEYSCIVRVK